MDSELAEPKMDQPVTKSKRSRHIVWVTVMTALLGVVVLVWTGRTNHSPRRTVAASPSPLSPSPLSPSPLSLSPGFEDPDAPLRKLLLGTWEREYHGSWIMKIKDAGQGTLEMRPSGLWATLIGEKVHVILNWSINDGCVELFSVSGEPETAFAAAKLIFGDRRIRKIKELTETRLVLLDEEDDSEAKWTRTTPASE
jgi:hypothetical protein